MEKQLAHNIKRLMLNQSVSIRGLARMTGLSPTGVHQIVRGGNARVSSLYSIADCFGVPVGDLFGTQDMDRIYSLAHLIRLDGDIPPKAWEQAGEIKFIIESRMPPAHCPGGEREMTTHNQERT